MRSSVPEGTVDVPVIAWYGGVKDIAAVVAVREDTVTATVPEASTVPGQKRSMLVGLVVMPAVSGASHAP